MDLVPSNRPLKPASADPFLYFGAVFRWLGKARGRKPKGYQLFLLAQEGGLVSPVGLKANLFLRVFGGLKQMERDQFNGRPPQLKKILREPPKAELSFFRIDGWLAHRRVDVVDAGRKVGRGGGG